MILGKFRRFGCCTYRMETAMRNDLSGKYRRPLASWFEWQSDDRGNSATKEHDGKQDLAAYAD
ncbi:hypothetical protein D3C73_1620720 [compost metagenome]